MKEAIDFIDVQVLQHGREIAAGRYKLPFTIGRAAKDRNSLVIGPDDRTISSVHADIECSDGRLRLTDRSRNGTYHNARKLARFESVDLADDDRFNIRGYTVAVKAVRLNPTIANVFEAEIFENNVSKLRLNIGEMALLLVRTHAGLWFEPIPFTGTDYASIIGRHRREGENIFAVLVGAHRQGSLFVDFNAAPPVVLLNRAPVSQRESILAPLDVIQIDSARIELHAPGRASLVCRNPRCGLLNPYDHHDFCRFCGFGLVESETRVTGQ